MLVCGVCTVVCGVCTVCVRVFAQYEQNFQVDSKVKTLCMRRIFNDKRSRLHHSLFVCLSICFCLSVCVFVVLWWWCVWYGEVCVCVLCMCVVLRVCLCCVICVWRVWRGVCENRRIMWIAGTKFA